ncbi:SDR family oxidoreductase [Aurantimonas sp. Leaf443]|uniref:SDR family oxidoreductase n=1 Tax=Aurantimonas sp. Leaf443 TaxID=1736378 RepID=UPI0006F27B8C|nr:SDR family oxidoreductase [Aurantimonas sp. Leaf443]KQT86339.1 3-oxoacyl-ACP reductase [Aurantimonas sp. Leaf443]
MGLIDDLFSLDGRTALVTGGATGIGRMIATGFAGAGARVLIASRKAEACEATAGEINAMGLPGHVEAFGGDVASEAGVKALVASVAERTQALHILVNNAGISWGAPFESFPHEAFARVMGVNVAGLFSLTQGLMPMLVASASAEAPSRVLNLGSVMGAVPLAERVYSYAASKAAVHHLTRCLAKEFAARHVTVNALAPGPFASKMTAFATGTDEKAAAIGAGVPLGRIGRPDDAAGAALFLCSRAGAYVTGAILPLDGGIGVQTGPELFPE